MTEKDFKENYPEMSKQMRRREDVEIIQFKGKTWRVQKIEDHFEITNVSFFYEEVEK